MLSLVTDSDLLLSLKRSGFNHQKSVLGNGLFATLLHGYNGTLTAQGQQKQPDVCIKFSTYSAGQVIYSLFQSLLLTAGMQQKTEI